MKYGYNVMIGSRDKAKQQELLSTLGTGAQAGDFNEVAAFADTLVLAVKAKGAISALALCGAENLKGKTIIDTTNPIDDLPPVNGVLRFFTNLDESMMEQLQKAFPSAHFVKAFNCVGSGLMVDPDFGGIKPSMFICGNDENAKKEVGEAITRFGWEIADMGAMEAARAIEPLCMLWCIPGLRENEWMGHAFKMLKK
jgi:predicted dinucleotide-binding enzyme